MLPGSRPFNLFQEMFKMRAVLGTYGTFTKCLSQTNFAD